LVFVFVAVAVGGSEAVRLGVKVSEAVLVKEGVKEALGLGVNVNVGGIV
jgi:hypothetical protein